MRYHPLDAGAFDEGRRRRLSYYSNRVVAAESFEVRSAAAYNSRVNDAIHALNNRRVLRQSRRTTLAVVPTVLMLLYPYRSSNVAVVGGARRGGLWFCGFRPSPKMMTSDGSDVRKMNAYFWKYSERKTDIRCV